MSMRWRAGLLFGVCYVVARMALVYDRYPDALHIDTYSYLEGVSFVGNAPRPWVLPLLLELPRWSQIVAVQSALSAIAFLVLAVAVASRVRNETLQLAVAGLIVLIGLTPRVTYWDAMVLSESLALSFTALLMAGLIWLDKVPWPAFAVVFTLWLFVRDGHTYLGLIVLAGLIWWGWRRKRYVLPAVCAAALVWSFAAGLNDRYVEGSTAAAAIAYYAWDDHDWFIDHGVPEHEALREPNFQQAFHQLYFDDPEWKAWADDEGQTVVAKYLLTHPVRLVERMPQMYFDGGFIGEAAVDHTYMIQIDVPGVTWFWPNDGTWYTLTLTLVAAGAALYLWRSKRLDRRWLLPGILAASSVPHAWMALMASPFEYGRHGLVMAFVLVISCWWMIALAIDAMLLSSETDQIEQPADELVGEA